ncbi:succinyl-CoA synthetase-like protein [Hypoxylon rubiginosum]|uniref:Succinyl-CoA synthetase-like protein n=1 Tax=Hypoxylon rubiginosum TaxID=110542 RepID=A0ACB9ZG76_9PEZI|nr:succinyl-CoA synthetase-like protein [Hypoxylon rubiginosum]
MKTHTYSCSRTCTHTNLGKQATANARESLEWGTKIIGGVTPGREGEHLGLPVLPNVRKAMEVLKPDATGIYVAAHQATGAIEEAIEAEVPLIVAVAEHIPLHDMLRIHSILKTQSTCRLVGANSPGIISAVGKCRIGFQPLPCFEPGRIGIVARSGTLSYETAASTLRSGLGQSMCIGVGGDILPGTSIREGLQILVEDNDTEGIALIGEIGGDAELEAADWIREYRAKTTNPKPIAALIGGVKAVPGRIMGHAGAFALPGEPSALDKIEALKGVGAAIVNHPSRFGPVLKSMLSGSTPTGAGVATSGGISQRREMHTIARRPVSARLVLPKGVNSQKRTLYITQSAAFDLLRRHGVSIAEKANPGAQKLLAVTVNRSTRSPCVIASPSSDASEAAKFDFAYGASGNPDVSVAALAEHMRLDASSADSLGQAISALVAVFAEKEAFLLETRVVPNNNGDRTTIELAAARFGFDDAAFRSCGRQADAQGLRDAVAEDPAEVGVVEKDGIVYIKLEDGDIGTLVNGAGLAMNTVDALADAGGRAANFLDTGGKATSETVKRSFEVILTDPRVKCIFVNIFGGLTRGDMIADGIVMAFRDLRMSVPVVVRIRGTNEKEGQRIIAESGLPLFAFDDFDEAAAKAIELAKEGLHL